MGNPYSPKASDKVDNIKMKDRETLKSFASIIWRSTHPILHQISTSCSNARFSCNDRIPCVERSQTWYCFKEWTITAEFDLNITLCVHSRTTKHFGISPPESFGRTMGSKRRLYSFLNYIYIPAEPGIRWIISRWKLWENWFSFLNKVYLVWSLHGAQATLWNHRQQSRNSYSDGAVTIHV